MVVVGNIPAVGGLVGNTFLAVAGEGSIGLVVGGILGVGRRIDRRWGDRSRIVERRVGGRRGGPGEDGA